MNSPIASSDKNAPKQRLKMPLGMTVASSDPPIAKITPPRIIQKMFFVAISPFRECIISEKTAITRKVRRFIP